MGAQRVSDAVRATWDGPEEHVAADACGKRPFAYTGESEAVQAIYEHTWRWLSGQSSSAVTLRLPMSLTESTAQVQVLQNVKSTEIERTAAAYCLGRTDAAGVSVLADSLLHSKWEEVRRAACYGLRSAIALHSGTVATEYAVESLQAAVDGPFMLANGAVGGTVAWLHALHFAPPSDRLMCCLEQFVARTLAEIEERTTSCAVLGHLTAWKPLLANRYQTDVAIDFEVTDRRRSLTEACSVLSALGTAALLGCGKMEREEQLALAVRACEVLLTLTSIPEPGVAFPSYLGHTVVTGEASSALLRLCSDATFVAASTPAARKVPVDWQNPGPEFNTVRSNVAEARRRLEGLCGSAAVSLGINDEITKGREQILELLCTASFPWDIASSDYVPLAAI